MDFVLTICNFQAKELVASLEWLNTPIPLRLRTIIFTSNAPVSTRWKALVVSIARKAEGSFVLTPQHQRLLFALAFFTCMWIAWITLRGAVRAHRQRLVWGERLMS